MAILLIVAIVIGILFTPFAIGKLSYSLNKSQAFLNHANKLLNPFPDSKRIILPYLPEMVDKIIEYFEKQETNDNKLKFIDEIDILEYCLKCLTLMVFSEDRNYFMPQVRNCNPPHEIKFILATIISKLKVDRVKLNTP